MRERLVKVLEGPEVYEPTERIMRLFWNVPGAYVAQGHGQHGERVVDLARWVRSRRPS